MLKYKVPFLVCRRRHVHLLALFVDLVAQFGDVVRRAQKCRTRSNRRSRCRCQCRTDRRRTSAQSIREAVTKRATALVSCFLGGLPCDACELACDLALASCHIRDKGHGRPSDFNHAVSHPSPPSSFVFVLSKQGARSSGVHPVRASALSFPCPVSGRV